MPGLSSLLLIAIAGAAVPADPCASAPPGANLTARVVTTRVARDSTVTATVCIVPPKAAAAAKAPAIGSYHGELYFDSTAARVVRVEKGAGGVRVENSGVPGQVNFAGAAPSGFAGHMLVSVVLKVRRPAGDPALRLLMKELNTTGGTSLMPQLVVAEQPQ